MFYFGWMLSLFFFLCINDDNSINSNIDMNGSTLSKQKMENTVIYMTSGKFNVLNCIFEKLHSDDQGGAISANNPELCMTVKSSGFKLCYAQKSGGAILFQGLSFNLDSTCFLGCISFDKGQAYKATYSKEINNITNSLNLITIDQCGPSRNPGESCLIFAEYSMFSAAQSNFTKSHVNDIGSALCIGHSISFSIIFTNFESLTGVNSLWLHNINEKDVFSQCNIIEMNLPKNNNEAIFALEETFLVLSNVRFIRNVADVYFLRGNVSIVSCIFDIKFSQSIFGANCKFTLDQQSYFGEKKAKPIPINEIQTWDCWAIGVEKPTFGLQSKLNDELSNQQVISGVLCMLVISLIGTISGLFCFYIVVKYYEKQNEKNQELQKTNAKGSNKNILQDEADLKDIDIASTGSD